MRTLFLSGQNRDVWFLNEDGLYEVCMKSRKPIAKQMKKEIKKYLKSIRLTSAAIPTGDEQRMVSYLQDSPFSFFTRVIKSHQIFVKQKV